MTKLDPEEFSGLLRRHMKWSSAREGRAISRHFHFASFLDAMDFVQAVAVVAEDQGHYPEWSNAGDRVDIVLTSHEVGGLSKQDAELALAIDTIADRFAGGTPPRDVAILDAFRSRKDCPDR